MGHPWRAGDARSDDPGRRRIDRTFLLGAVCVRCVYRVCRNSHAVREEGNSPPRKKLYATPLFLVLLVVEITDITLAIDSIPAIFGITQDPFIVYTSNVFAILGLRKHSRCR